MKNDMKPFFLLGIFLLLASSCLKDVDLEDLRPDPKLVLNSVALANQPLTASLSRTWFYTENYPNVTIKDAKVSLYVNDHFCEQLSWEPEETGYFSTGNYVSSYRPVSGDKVRIEVEKEGFKPISAESVVPVKPALLNLTVEDVSRQENGYYVSSRVYKITFRDAPSANNCYLIRVQESKCDYEYDSDSEEKFFFTGKYSWDKVYLDYSTEPVFSNKISVLDKLMGNDWLSGNSGRPFSDELFNGKEYTLKISGYTNYYGNYPPSYPPPSEADTIFNYCKVYLYQVSESYYKYLSALAELDDSSLNNDLVSAGLAEPIRVCSNIQGGTGILGAACVDSLIVRLPKPHAH